MQHQFCQKIDASDIIVFSESKLTLFDTLVFPTNDSWTIIRADRHGGRRAGGGCGVFIKRSLPEIHHEVICTGLISLTIPSSLLIDFASDLTILASYIPPPYNGLSKRAFDVERDLIFHHIESRFLSKLHSFILVGDTNSRVGNRDDRGVVFPDDGEFSDVQDGPSRAARSLNLDPSVNENCRRLLDLCKCFDSLILNGKSIPYVYTCFGPSGGTIPDAWIASSDCENL